MPTEDCPTDFHYGFSGAILAVCQKSETNNGFIDRFQLVIGGLEIANGFSELNDPIDQRERYELQEKSGLEAKRELLLRTRNILKPWNTACRPPAA